MNKRAVFLLVTALSMVVAASAWSQNGQVVFQSRTVSPGTQNVTLNITADWYEPLFALTVPVVVREIDPGAFWTGNLPVDTAGGAAIGVDWKWADPWPNFILEVRPGVPALSCGPQVDLGYEGISPDHFVVNAAWAATSATPEPDGRAFLALTFDVTESVGRFEFDTACFSTSLGTIYMTFWPPCDPYECPVFFTKGTVTICICEGLGDCNGDAAINPVDVIYMVNHVYRGGSPPPAIPGCPAINGDWNCDEKINPVDVMEIVNFVYRNSTMLPCNPCTGGNLPDPTVAATDIALTYSSPYAAGDPVWVGMKVRNIGRAAAIAPKVRVYNGDPGAGGTLLGSGTLADIPPGGESTYFYFGTYHFTTPGTVEIHGVVDFENALAETNENNNQAVRTLEVMP